MFRIIISLLAILYGTGCAVASPPPDDDVAKPFQTGWWTDVTRPAYLAGYAAAGTTLVLANGAGWFTASSDRGRIGTYLDEAQKQGVKVIVSMTRKYTPKGTAVKEFTDTITAYKDHPALFAWYIGDEPEIYDNHDANPDDDWMITHGYLAASPGYYQLAKSADPVHPILISFNMLYDPLDSYYAKVQRFFDVTDLVGMHNYPFWRTDSEFEGGDSRMQYDVWKYMLEKTAQNDKAGFIATAQGFGTNSHDAIYRDPTYAELRHQVFSAVVLGIDTVLFWYDGWSSLVMKERVKQMVGQIQAIGAPMNNGITNDTRIGVSVADRNRLVYRYGTSGGDRVILAVNIANRSTAGGAALNDVRFTLPDGVNSTQVTVLDENRTLSVTSGAFSDSFAPFAVHIYKF